MQLGVQKLAHLGSSIPLSRATARAFLVVLVAPGLLDGATRRSAQAFERPEPATLSLGASAFYATSKSGLAESNDTGLITNYGLNIFAGERKNLSVHLEQSNSQFAYELNKAKLTYSDLNFSIRLHFSIFYVGGFAGTVQATGTRADGTTFDAFGSQFGGNAGSMLRLNRESWLGFDAQVAMPNSIKEANKQNITLGMKMDAKVFVNYDVTRKFLDLQAGYFHSVQQATFLGTGKGETVTAPFLGFLMSTSF
jgi:hypothetical protein